MQKEIISYRVTSAKTHTELIQLVQDFIDDGYQPFGSIVVNEQYMHQPVVKYADDSFGLIGPGTILRTEDVTPTTGTPLHAMEGNSTGTHVPNVTVTQSNSNNNGNQENSNQEDIAKSDDKKVDTQTTAGASAEGERSVGGPAQ